MGVTAGNVFSAILQFVSYLQKTKKTLETLEPFGVSIVYGSIFASPNFNYGRNT